MRLSRVESSLSQGVRRFELRRSRSIRLARTQLQQTINATAMNLVRLVDWLRKGRWIRSSGDRDTLPASRHLLSSGWRLASQCHRLLDQCALITTFRRT